ncbi:hypothetical protein [Zhongshania aquimaris]|nr:hypothetical protein [Zhongshania aquimaris]
MHTSKTKGIRLAHLGTRPGSGMAECGAVSLNGPIVILNSIEDP